MLPDRRVSSAAANNPIRIISATCSRGRSAERPAMNSWSRSAARIIARFIAPATSGCLVDGGRHRPRQGLPSAVATNPAR